MKEKYFLRQTKTEGFFFNSRSALQELLKENLKSDRKKKIIWVRLGATKKEGKCIEEGISKGKINFYFSYPQLI